MRATANQWSIPGAWQTRWLHHWTAVGQAGTPSLDHMQNVYNINVVKGWFRPPVGGTILMSTHGSSRVHTHPLQPTKPEGKCHGLHCVCLVISWLHEMLKQMQQTSFMARRFLQTALAKLETSVFLCHWYFMEVHSMALTKSSHSQMNPCFRKYFIKSNLTNN